MEKTNKQHTGKQPSDNDDKREIHAVERVTGQQVTGHTTHR
jgi:hypothetical protein